MSSKNLRLPTYVQELLEQYGCSVVSFTLLNGMGHPYIQFRCPDGSVRKWSWPHAGRSDPRALRNNCSQLKHYLRRLFDEGHTVPFARTQHARAAS